MDVDKSREEKLKLNYKNVLEKFNKSKENSKLNNHNIILTAVSKKRPVEDIQVIYNEGQRIFGENYPQELLEKSKKLPKDIEWHLIGHLQSNKVKKLLDEIPNLIIESVDRAEIVDTISKYSSTKNKTKVYVEVNISGKDSKTGCPENDLFLICDSIMKFNQTLELIGIMSLGNVGDIDEFKKMLELKDKICEKYSLDKNKFIASFGTSQDFEKAIENGSDEVRIGHQIFEVN